MNNLVLVGKPEGGGRAKGEEVNAEESFLKVIDEKIGIAEKNAKEWSESEESALYFSGIAICS